MAAVAKSWEMMYVLNCSLHFFLIQITFTEDLASVRHQARQLDTTIKSKESLLARTPSILRTFRNVWPFYTLPVSNRNHLYLAYKPGNL